MEFTCGLLSEDVHRSLYVPQRDLELPAAQTDVLLNEVLPPHHGDQEETDGERPTVDVNTDRGPRRLTEQDVRREVRGGRVGSQGRLSKFIFNSTTENNAFINNINVKNKNKRKIT